MKIYSKANYVHIVDVNGKLLSAIKKEVEILPTNDEKTEYKIFGFKDISPRDSFSLHHFVKEDGSAFTLTQWEDFYMANTGNYGIEQAPAVDYTPKLQTIIDKIDSLKPLLIDIDNNTDTLETSNDAIVVNTQQIEDKIDLLKPKFEIGIELVDGANGSNVGVDFTYTIPQSIHQMSMISEVKIGTATSKGSITSNYVLTAGVLQVFSVGTMNGQYIWINGTKI